MKRPCLVVILVLCCGLILLAVGCADQQTTTTTVPSETTTTESVPLGAWTKLAPAGDLPAARAGLSMVFDPSSSKVILFGGWDATDATDFGDTWAYDPAADSWTNLEPDGEVPPARHDHAMAFDEGTGQVLLFGGIEVSTYRELGDTWAYDPATNTWENLDPAGDLPTARSLHSMIYDPAAAKVVLFGGTRSGACLGDMWNYDWAANAWTQIELTGDGPLGLYGCGLVYDLGLGQLVLVGGSDGHLVSMHDTWTYDSTANAWTKLSTGGQVPSAREFFGIAYDPEAHLTVLFGGCDIVALNDTWAYDSAADSWTNLNPSGDTPSARIYPSLVYAPGTGTFILFGGADNLAAKAPVGDLLSFDVAP